MGLSRLLVIYVNLKDKLKKIQTETANKDLEDVLKAKIANFPGSDNSLDFVYQKNIGHKRVCRHTRNRSEIGT